MLSQSAATQTKIETWHIDRLVFYVRNPRKNDAAVERMCGSIREFGFKCPILARSDGEEVDGHLSESPTPAKHPGGPSDPLRRMAPPPTQTIPPSGHPFRLLPTAL